MKTGKLLAGPHSTVKSHPLPDLIMQLLTNVYMQPILHNLVNIHPFIYRSADRLHNPSSRGIQIGVLVYMTQRETYSSTKFEHSISHFIFNLHRALELLDRDVNSKSKPFCRRP